MEREKLSHNHLVCLFVCNLEMGSCKTTCIGPPNGNFVAVQIRDLDQPLSGTLSGSF